MGRGFGMVKDKVKNTSGANIEVWIVEKGVLHVLLIEFTVYLGPGPLHEAVRFVKSTEAEDIPRQQRPLSGSRSETGYQRHLNVEVEGESKADKRKRNVGN